jgi:hypothetical protein
VRPTPLNHQYRAALSRFAGLYSLSSSSTSSSSQSDKWETSMGDFYDAGTLELDHNTFDLLTDIANEMETLSDERENDESDLE